MAIDKLGKSVLSAAEPPKSPSEMAAQLGKVVSRKVTAGNSASQVSKNTVKADSYAESSKKGVGESGKTFAGLKAGRFGSTAPATTKVASNGAPGVGHIAAAERLIEIAQGDASKAATILAEMFKSADLARNNQGQYVTTDETAQA